MKTLLWLTLALTPALALADDAPYKPECLEQAKKAVGEKAKAAVSFFDAALVGDGVDGAEIITFKPSGKNGLYIVTMEYDDCSVFAAPKLLAN